ncbi:MAG: TetR/AcrR family transcriptional regulator [Candidatus Onthomonas sp.]
MGKVAENKHQKEQNLLDTAFELFTTKGFAKTSISDIVERAGMAKGTFYLYFRDKYDIQEKLIVREAGQVFHHALNHVDFTRCGGLADRLTAIVDDALEQLQQDQELLRFINKNLSWGIFRRALHKSSDDYLGTYERILAGSGEQVEEPVLLLYTILELVSSTCHSVILEQDPADLEHYKPYLYRSIRAIVESFRVKEGEKRG